jgi:uncharacterized protein (TIGR02588 family)
MKRNWLEWLVLGASAAAILVLVAVVTGTGLLGGDRPPNPAVALRAQEGREAAHGWIVPGTVRNDGDSAAEAVVLEASATVGGEEELSEFGVDYLPPGTEVDVEFGFSGRPDGEISVRVVSMRPST